MAGHLPEVVDRFTHHVLQVSLPAQTDGFTLPSFGEVWSVLSLEDYNTRLVVLCTMALGLASGLIGTFLLLRKRSLMGDALSHACLPGIGLAFIVLVAMGLPGKSLPGLLAGAIVTGVLGVLAVLAIRNTSRIKDDAAMGIVLSVFYGAGVAVLGFVQSIPEASAAGLQGFIQGKTASMVASDRILLFSVAGLVVAASLLLKKEFMLLCFDEGFASSQGWPVHRLDLLMLLLVSLVTVAGLQAVGLILIIAYLIIPAAAARFWTERLGSMLLLSGLIGAASGWLGASFSALLWKLPAGAIIVLVAAAIFLLSLLFGTARGVVPRLLERVRLNRKVGRQHLLRAVYEILENSDSDRPPANKAVTFGELLAKRSWSESRLLRLVRRARKDGFVESFGEDSLELSETGFGEASRITRNHRLWEIFLITRADIAPSHVDRDADSVEHVLGPELVRELEKGLGTRDLPASPHPMPTTGVSP